MERLMGEYVHGYRPPPGTSRYREQPLYINSVRGKMLVWAVPIVIKGWKDHEFFVYRWAKNRYRIAEMFTGLIVGWGHCRTAVIEDAKKHLKEIGKEKFLDGIENLERVN